MSLVVEYLTRPKVGYRTDLPRLGYVVPRGEREGFVKHHTVGADSSDFTKNTWDRAHALEYARDLQTIRPDLGLDVPYNFVAFVLEPQAVADVLIVEGRGWDRSGAHTVDPDRSGSENRDLIAISWAGDFRVGGGALNQGWPAHVEAVGAWARVQMNRLGGFNIDPDAVTGHRDHKNTTCPGDLVYDNLHLFSNGLRGSTPPTPPLTWTEELLTNLPILGRYDGFTNPPDGSKAHPELRQDVRRAQALLAVEGFIASNTFDADHKPDGLFGDGTHDATVAFQKDRDLTQDGLIGEDTWGALLGV